MDEEAKLEKERLERFMYLTRLRPCGHVCAREFTEGACCNCVPQDYHCGARVCELPSPEDCIVVEDAPNRLNIDIDNAWARQQWEAELPNYAHLFRSVEEWSSRNGNTHIMVTLKSPMPYTERISLQRNLGSDAGRFHYDINRPYGLRRNVLFKPIRA